MTGQRGDGQSPGSRAGSAWHWTRHRGVPRQRLVNKGAALHAEDIIVGRLAKDGVFSGPRMLTIRDAGRAAVEADPFVQRAQLVRIVDAGPQRGVAAKVRSSPGRKFVSGSMRSLMRGCHGDIDEERRDTASVLIQTGLVSRWAECLSPSAVAAGADVPACPEDGEIRHDLVPLAGEEREMASWWKPIEDRGVQ